MITFGINFRFQKLFPTWGQVTHVFLTLAPLRYCYLRSTCMPNPCRQRSFWARIKLSKQKYWTACAVLYFEGRDQIPFTETLFYVPDLLFLTTVPQSYDLKTWLKAHRTIQFSKNICQLPGNFINIAVKHSALFNLASFFDLSNDFLKNLETFFSTALPEGEAQSLI